MKLSNSIIDWLLNDQEENSLFKHNYDSIGVLTSIIL